MSAEIHAAARSRTISFFCRLVGANFGIQRFTEEKFMASSRLSWVAQLARILEAPVPDSRLREFEHALQQIIRERHPQLSGPFSRLQQVDQFGIEAADIDHYMS
jgi:hypothetical protein